MSVLTESQVRQRLKGKSFRDFTELRVKKGDIITPSARSFLRDNNITLIFVNDEDEVVAIEPSLKDLKEEAAKAEANRAETAKAKRKEQIFEEKVFDEKESGGVTYKFETIFGAKLNEKPEHMTHLNGNLLVFKDHKRIALRGKIDSLESKILEAQVKFYEAGYEDLVNDLQEVLDFVRNLIRCEVLEEPVAEIHLLGMSAEDLRERSHHPKKYFGIPHFFPDYSMGDIVITLNSIRTLIRETELMAYDAFKGQYGNVEREDIIRAFNRLSSLLWIMMFKFRSGEYKKKEDDKNNGN